MIIDDAGFGNPSTFDGPITTPNFSRMVGEGLRYNRFRVTALCSPARAALQTGQNSRTVGFGSVGGFAGGFRGYSATFPRDCAPLARTLKDNGYSTAAFGKWHLTPDGQQGPAGPLDRCPICWGLDYFYGFLGGGANEWEPYLAEDQRTIGTPPESYSHENPWYFPMRWRVGPSDSCTALGAVGSKALHKKTASEVEKMAEETVPIGGPGLTRANPHSSTEKAEPAVTRALQKVIGEAEGRHVKALNAALANAQQKMLEQASEQ